MQMVDWSHTIYATFASFYYVVFDSDGRHEIRKIQKRKSAGFGLTKIVLLKSVVIQHKDYRLPAHVYYVNVSNRTFLKLR